MIIRGLAAVYRRALSALSVRVWCAIQQFSNFWPLLTFHMVFLLLVSPPRTEQWPNKADGPILQYMRYGGIRPWLVKFYIMGC